MSSQASRPIYQLLAVGILVVGIAGLYAGIIAPVWERIHATRMSIEENRAILGRFQAEENQVGKVTAQTSMVGTEATPPVFLIGSTNAARVANLQARIGELASTAGVAVMSAREVGQQERSGMPSLGVEIQFTATSAALKSLLVALEYERPHLFIDGLQVSPAPNDVSATTDPSSKLDCTLRVIGFVEQAKG